MSYLSRYSGEIYSKAKAGIAQDKNNPAQLGYSVSIPFNRVRKQDLSNTRNINITALNRPDSNLTTTPANSIGTLSTFTDQATQFASDLYNETKSFLTDQTIGSIPNYLIVGGAIILLLSFKTGKHRGSKR